MVPATLLPGLLDPALAARCLAVIDSLYADPALRTSPGFSASSSSMRLTAIESIDGAALVSTVFEGVLATLCRRELGSDAACALDECWVRRQYPPDRYPRGHAAHSWHQDGALGFDFIACAGLPCPRDALLPMVTCWIALSPCGQVAPGLEFAGTARARLLDPDDLSEPRVRAQHDASELHRPVLSAGDALAFAGGVLHRTHVTAAMTRERTSIELRFVAPARLGDRLRGQQLLALH